jgi:hypothetical protein
MCEGHPHLGGAEPTVGRSRTRNPAVRGPSSIRLKVEASCPETVVWRPGLDRVLCALEPQPVLDFETQQPRADENGEPLYVVQLIALAEGEAEILAVKVAGLPSGIRQGHPVKVHGLVAQPWTMNDRAGVAFRAARIEPVVTQAKAS